jgi:hypothetical protein
MVNREGLCVVDAWLSDIGSRAEKRVNKDGVLPLRLDSVDRGPFKLLARMAVGAFKQVFWAPSNSKSSTAQLRPAGCKQSS